MQMERLVVHCGACGATREARLGNSLFPLFDVTHTEDDLNDGFVVVKDKSSLDVDVQHFYQGDQRTFACDQSRLECHHDISGRGKHNLVLQSMTS
jgi:hypothetical protein